MRKIIVAIGLLGTLGGCVASNGGYVAYGGAAPGPGYYEGLDADYYEPYGFYGGGWGAGYDVAPFGHEGHRFDRGRYEHAGFGRHAYHSAPFGHRMPSLAGHGHGGHMGGMRVGR